MNSKKIIKHIIWIKTLLRKEHVIYFMNNNNMYKDNINSHIIILITSSISGHKYIQFG